MADKLVLFRPCYAGENDGNGESADAKPDELERVLARRKPTCLRVTGNLGR
jgi:hypothetical protein